MIVETSTPLVLFLTTHLFTRLNASYAISLQNLVAIMIMQMERDAHVSSPINTLDDDHVLPSWYASRLLGFHAADDRPTSGKKLL